MTPEPYEQAQFTPWPDRDPDMAEAAEALAQKLGISRQAQDDWAVTSHQAALEGVQSDQIVPVAGQEADAFTRKLTPRLCVRAPVVAGSVTAANMAVAADGAAFVLVVSDRVARRLSAPKSGSRPDQALAARLTCPVLLLWPPSMRLWRARGGRLTV